MIRIPKKKESISEPFEESYPKESLRAEPLFKKKESFLKPKEEFFEGEDFCPDSKEGGSSSDDGKRAPALSAAFRILQSGANSKKMLREKLLKKGFSKKECEEAIEECVALRFLDEKRLFLSYVSLLAKKKHYGKKRIYAELLKKFDRDSISLYFEEATEELDFTQYAREEVLKQNRRDRTYLERRLYTLGYSPHEIRDALLHLPRDRRDPFEEEDLP